MTLAPIAADIKENGNEIQLYAISNVTPEYNPSLYS